MIQSCAHFFLYQICVVSNACIRLYIYNDLIWQLNIQLHNCIVCNLALCYCWYAEKKCKYKNVMISPYFCKYRKTTVSIKKFYLLEILLQKTTFHIFCNCIFRGAFFLKSRVFYCLRLFLNNYMYSQKHFRIIFLISFLYLFYNINSFLQLKNSNSSIYASFC